jgi:hypothetical protein
MSIIDRALEANRKYAKGYDPALGKRPAPKLAVVTCNYEDLRSTAGRPHWEQSRQPRAPAGIGGYSWGLSTRSSGKLGLQSSDALTERLNSGLDLLFGEARRDVLRTIPIIGRHVNQYSPLDLRLILRYGQRFKHLRALGPDQFRVSQQL